MKHRDLTAVAKFVENRGCATIVRKDRVEFSVVYVSETTGELIQEVIAVATIKDARIALKC